jgi:alkylation response protein AidB-like acyl-CoA dehydrogenase
MADAPDQSLARGDEQHLIRESALQFLADEDARGQIRALRDADDARGWSPALWSGMCELGWPGLLAPESESGAGLGLQEIGVLFEALGRHAAHTPLFASGVLALTAIERVRGWKELPGVVDGATVAALAIEESTLFDPYLIETEAKGDGDSVRLTGRKRLVLDGAMADVWLVVARSGSELGLFAVDPGQFTGKPAVVRWIDGRRVAEPTFDGTPAKQIGDAVSAEELIEVLVDRAAATASAELMGLASEAFAMTLEYLKTRVQFDQALAEFQALQHRMARMFAEIERAISIVQDALRGLDEGDAEASLLASAAKARASEVARLVTSEALQLHGGLGMTEEQDIGLFYKRARVTSTIWGDAGYHHRRFARLSGF